MSLSPPQSEKVSVEAFETAIAAIERRLGLTDQPCAIVFHERKGHRHAHCVWSRINTAKIHTEYTSPGNVALCSPTPGTDPATLRFPKSAQSLRKVGDAA